MQLKGEETTIRKFIKEKQSRTIFRHNDDIVNIPSLAMIKYFNTFKRHEETSARFEKYLESVQKGEKKMNVSTTNVYDIYKNRHKIDPDLFFFSQLEKVKGNWLPIVDTSGSMQDNNDSFGKAISIGHYLGKTSTYMPNHVVSFSSHPQLIELGVTKPRKECYAYNPFYHENIESQYIREISTGCRLNGLATGLIRKMFLSI